MSLKSLQDYLCEGENKANVLLAVDYTEPW